MSDSLEQVSAALQQLAERFYARPNVQYSVRVEESAVNPDSYCIHQMLHGENSKALADSLVTAGALDAVAHGKVALEAMVVRSGLDAPRTEPHKIKLTGDSAANSIVSIDGHALQSLYSAEFKVDMESEYKVTLGFVAPFAHLDVDVLPQNLTLDIEGLYDCLECLTELNDLRNANFADIEFAKAHSTTEETELYRKINALLTRYKPSSSG